MFSVVIAPNDYVFQRVQIHNTLGSRKHDPTIARTQTIALLNRHAQSTPCIDCMCHTFSFYLFKKKPTVPYNTLQKNQLFFMIPMPNPYPHISVTPVLEAYYMEPCAFGLCFYYHEYIWSLTMWSYTILYLFTTNVKF